MENVHHCNNSEISRFTFTILIYQKKKNIDNQNDLGEDRKSGP